MADDGMNSFDPEHLERWWATTRRYLFADLDSLAGEPAETEGGWSAPKPDSLHGRKKYLARVRGRFLRSIRYDRRDDPLEELHLVFQRRITFIASHPDVPQHLLSWLAQDGERGLQRGVRRLIGHYADRLARIIARAKRRGCVRADVDPHAAAILLVRLIQGLVLRTPAAVWRKERFMAKAAEAFAGYRSALVISSD